MIKSISDKAFILLCLINYGKRWYAKLVKVEYMVGMEILFVSQLNTMVKRKELIAPSYLSQKKGTWTDNDERKTELIVFYVLPL